MAYKIYVPEYKSMMNYFCERQKYPKRNRSSTISMRALFYESRESSERIEHYKYIKMQKTGQYARCSIQKGRHITNISWSMQL